MRDVQPAVIGLGEEAPPAPAGEGTTGPGGPRARSRAAAALGTRGAAAIAAAIVAAAILPQVTSDQYWLDVLSQAGLFVLLSAGLNVVVSLAGLLDLGYIAFWGIGAYTTALLASGHYDIHLPMVALLPLSVVATSIFAIVIGFPTLRLRGDYLAVVTLGFGEIVRIALLNGGRITGGSAGIQDIDPPSVAGHAFGYLLEPYYYLVLVACMITLLLGYLLRNSVLGIAWQALRDDETAARTCGLRPLHNYLLAFGIGAAFAGVSGTLFALKETAVSPGSFTADQSFLVLAIVVLGGARGLVSTAALSALVVIVLPEALRSLHDYRMVVFGPILVATIVVRANWPFLRGAMAESALARRWWRRSRS